MMTWAGNAFLYQMGFFRFSGEPCCELKKGDEFLPEDVDDQEVDHQDTRRELTNKEVTWLVVESMKLEKLDVWSTPKWMIECRPRISVSKRLVSNKSRSRSRSRSPASRSLVQNIDIEIND
jgi:hypothetical protein